MKLKASLLALSFVAGAAFAQPAPGPRPAQRRAAVIAQYLQLTPDQIAAWKQIDADTAATVKPLLAEVRAARKAGSDKRVALLTPEQKAKLDAMRAAAAMMRRPR